MNPNIQIKNAFTKKESPTQYSITCGDGKTRQSFKEECDINNILARYQTSGILDFAQKHEPQYADVSAIDYQESMLKVAQAKSMFNDMPSSLRARFKNDPAQMLDFLQNPANRAEAETLGLVNASPTPPNEPTGAQNGVSGA